MKYTPVRALLALLQVVVLLTVQLAEGTGVHHCPEHDAGAGVGASTMATHMGHHGSQHQPDHSGCHCVGVCCKATLVHPAPAAILTLFTSAPVVAPQSPPVVTLRETLRLLPFALGPPTLA